MKIELDDEAKAMIKLREEIIEEIVEKVMDCHKIKQGFNSSTETLLFFSAGLESMFRFATTLNHRLINDSGFTEKDIIHNIEQIKKITDTLTEKFKSKWEFQKHERNATDKSEYSH